MVKKYNRLNQICPSSGQTLYPTKRKKIKFLPCPLRPKQPAACSCAPCLWNSVPLVQVSAPPWSLHCSYNKRTIGWSQWACCCLHLQLSPRHQPSPLPQASQAPAKCSPPGAILPGQPAKCDTSETCRLVPPALTITWQMTYLFIFCFLPIRTKFHGARTLFTAVSGTGLVQSSSLCAEQTAA